MWGTWYTYYALNFFLLTGICSECHCFLPPCGWSKAFACMFWTCTTLHWYISQLLDVWPNELTSVLGCISFPSRWNYTHREASSHSFMKLWNLHKKWSILGSTKDVNISPTLPLLPPIFRFFSKYLHRLAVFILKKKWIQL